MRRAVSGWLAQGPGNDRQVRQAGRLGGAAKATEAIADVMGAKGHRISQEGVEGTLRPAKHMTHRINKGSAGVYRVCGKRTHEKLP
jgi:hypothetical protein